MFTDATKWDESKAREVIATIDAASAAVKKLFGIVEDESFSGFLEDATDQLLALRMDALARLGAIVIEGKPNRVQSKKTTKGK